MSLKNKENMFKVRFEQQGTTGIKKNQQPVLKMSRTEKNIICLFDVDGTLTPARKVTWYMTNKDKFTYGCNLGCRSIVVGSCIIARLHRTGLIFRGVAKQGKQGRIRA